MANFNRFGLLGLVIDGAKAIANSDCGRFLGKVLKVVLVAGVMFVAATAVPALTVPGVVATVVVALS